MGAGNALAGLRTAEIDPMKVLSMYAHEQFIHLIPSTDFEEQQKFREGSQGGEAVDYIAGIVRKKP